MTAKPEVLAIMPDVDEPAVRRDLDAVRRSGARVRLAAFRRTAEGRTTPDLDLGPLPMGVGPRRLLAILRASGKLPRLGRMVGSAECVLARNLDMALIAVAAGAGGETGPPLVYQCLDIHNLVTREDAIGHLARAGERAVLARAARLVVSSPTFLPRHFTRYGSSLPEIVIRENRLVGAPHRPRFRPDKNPEGPWRLGWVGTLRCPGSLGLLLAATGSLGDRIALHLHGQVHHHALPDFAAQTAGRQGVVWHGPYAYPHDLASMYGTLDLVWAQDLWQRGTNSDWLLPNRLYEAGYFGCPVIALAGTQTGTWVERNGTGWVLGDPGDLPIFLANLSRQSILETRRHILSLPDALFAAPPEAGLELVGNLVPREPGDATSAAA